MHNPRPGVEHGGPGWYWIPAGQTEREYLAVNADRAAVRLLQLAEADDAGDPATILVLPRTLQAVAA